MHKFDVVVVGGGACGIMSAIFFAKAGKKVLLLEKLSKIAQKLKASGGGKCNLTNTLSNDEFMANFGKDGRFLRDILNRFNSKDLIEFFKQIGVNTDSLDGFRVFPSTHNSTTIIKALEDELNRVGVKILTLQRVIKILTKEQKIRQVVTQTDKFFTKKVVIATGGAGFSSLGGGQDGYNLAKELGHKITNLYPAMLPLKTKERWTKNLIADTVAKATIKIDIKKYKKLQAKGDLIFTKDGIRGPVVLDFAREITPLLRKYDEVPILVNISKGMNEDELIAFFKKNSQKLKILDTLNIIFAKSLSEELCNLAQIDKNATYSKLDGKKREKLVKLATWLPLTIVADDGFSKAMVTRGGVDLKQIDPKTMQSKLIDGLYFCGEVLNIDGPCGGYNLQFCFSSGYATTLGDK